MSRKDYTNYQEYLKSQEWQALRKVIIDRFGGRCAVCNSGTRLQVHHRYYKEKDCEDNLVLLCSRCHALFSKGMEALKAEKKSLAASKNKAKKLKKHKERDWQQILSNREGMEPVTIISKGV